MWVPLCALDPGDLKHFEKYIKFRTPKALRQYNLESKKMHFKGLFAKLVQVVENGLKYLNMPTKSAVMQILSRISCHCHMGVDVMRH